MDVRLLTPKDILEIPENHFKVLNDSNEWSGLTFECNGKHYIIYNPNQSLPRQESTIMHELAHIICGHHLEESSTVNNMGLILRSYNEEHENEAEWLGSCLQLPREGLLWALKNKMSTDQIASLYNASLQMTEYRINISGIKKQLQFSKKKYGVK